MANILNLPNCGGSTSTFNSGIPLCDFIRKEPKMLIMLDKGVEFDSTDLASVAALVAAIKTATRAARGSRAFPIKDLTNYEDKSTEATKAQIGNLSITQITMQQGVPSFAFQHRKGELFHQQLSAAENANLNLMIVDSAYLLLGTKTSGGNLTGFTLSEFQAELAKFATATDPSKYPFNVTLESITEYKENLALVQLDKTILDISGLRDVDLNTAGAPMVQAANVAKITPIARGGKNLGVLYPTELAVVSAWPTVNSQTGAATTVSSVSWDATNLRFNVTIDSTEYAAAASGDKWTTNLDNPADLKLLGVDGYESLGPVTITKP